MRTITYAAAIAEALAEEMERDEQVFLLGEDIGESGGVFGVTKGLQRRFGAERVLDTPISEEAIVGAAVGSALLGGRPVRIAESASKIACNESSGTAPTVEALAAIAVPTSCPPNVDAIAIAEARARPISGGVMCESNASRAGIRNETMTLLTRTQSVADMKLSWPSAMTRASAIGIVAMAS